MSGVLLDTRPLRSSPAFARLWLGTTAAALGNQLGGFAVLFHVWQVTGSPVWVAGVGLARGVPVAVMAVVGGAVADAVDRRRLLLLTTLGQGVAVALLAGSVLSGTGGLAALLVLVAAQAAFGAAGMPATRAVVPRLLGAAQVPAGVALSHLSFQLAVLAGPALGGLVVGGVGVGACLLAGLATHTVMLWGVASLPALPAAPSARRPGPRSLWQGAGEVVRRPVLSGALLADMAATVLAMPVALLPLLNAERFGGSPERLGLLVSAIGVGGLLASLLSGRVSGSRRPGRLLLLAAGVWGGALASLALAEAFWLALALLAVAGAADTVSVVSRGSLVQLATPEEYRGRVNGIDHAVGAAVPELGNLRGGLVAAASSAGVALATGGLACLLAVALLAWRLPALRRFDVSEAGTGRRQPPDAAGG